MAMRLSRIVARNDRKRNQVFRAVGAALLLSGPNLGVLRMIGVDGKLFAGFVEQLVMHVALPGRIAQLGDCVADFVE